MANSAANPKVDTFIGEEPKWREEYQALRAILRGFPLAEEFKWGKPCYALEGSNVVLMHGFKDYCALLFIKGALLRDPQKILVQQTENVQAGRQARFTNVRQITEMEPVLKAYIQEAIDIEKAGLDVEFKPTAGFSLPEELQRKFEELPALKTAFEALTPGRQRGYLLYFSQPKQEKTRTARIEKYVQQIFEGKGLDD